MEKVEAGMLSDFLGKIFDSFLKSLEGAFKEGGDKTDSEKGKVTVTKELLPNNPVIDSQSGKELKPDASVLVFTTSYQMDKKMILTRESAVAWAEQPNNWSNLEKVNIEMTFRKGNRVAKANISSKDAAKLFQQYCEKHDTNNLATKIVLNYVLFFTEGKMDDTSGGQQQESTASSSRLQISLKKIVGKTETEIQLAKINANYDILDAMNDVNQIVSDDEFINQLPENEAAFYDVSSDETDYDVNPCEDFSCCDTVQQMIFETLKTSIKMRILSMTSASSEFHYLDLSQTLDCIADNLSDALIDMGCAQVSGFDFMTDPATFDDPAASACAADTIQRYLDSLNIVYDCVSKGTQFKLNSNISHVEDILRDLKKS